jgi:CRISPR-associated endonuclease Csn1
VFPNSSFLNSNFPKSLEFVIAFNRSNRGVTILFQTSFSPQSCFIFEVIERQKQGLSSALEIDENGNRLLFTLSPNDLVYIPTNEEKENLTVIDFNKLSKEKTERIYKFVSCTGGEGHFVSNNYSKEIITNENGSNNKNERMLEFNNSNTVYDEKEKPVMIKSICWKLEIDRLGKIKRIIK